jgi:hypothetical protein
MITNRAREFTYFCELEMCSAVKYELIFCYLLHFLHLYFYDGVPKSVIFKTKTTMSFLLLVHDGYRRKIWLCNLTLDLYLPLPVQIFKRFREVNSLSPPFTYVNPLLTQRPNNSQVQVRNIVRESVEIRIMDLIM